VADTSNQSHPAHTSVKPVLLYDGDCEFCRRRVHRWRQKIGDAVEYEPARVDKVRLIEPSGREHAGAAAVLHALGLVGERRWVRGLYEHAPPFRAVADAAYAFVSRHRDGFARLDHLLYGNDQRTGSGTYFLTRSVFLRLLGVAYLAAFVSIAVQIDGLVGSRGIAPAAQFLAAIHERYGGEAYQLLPTLAWFDSSDTFLHVLSWGGVGVAMLLILGVLPQFCLVVLWAFYLSIVGVGQVFLGFQWDALILEAGFLAIFFAPARLTLWSRGQTPLSRVMRFLLVWLLFRLMFLSGVVKLTSGDPSWANWTAMSYHFETQPLPSWTSWYVHQAPMWVHKAETAATLALELFIPLLYFAPRRLRVLAFWLTLLLQCSIAATGNFGFFNLLAIAIAVVLLDDASFPKWLRDWRWPAVSQRRRRPAWRGIVLAPLAIVLLVATTAHGVLRAHFRPDWAVAAYSLTDPIEPYHVANAYGLFEVMTTERPEIIIQGSDDGLTWKSYAFRYKPDDDLTRRPRFCTPHMPRLDWQLWFAAMGDVNSSPWTIGLFFRLLEGSPDVLALFRDNPFPDHPPKYVRALLYQYHFTTRAQRARTGDWWTREPAGEFCPPVTLEDLRGIGE
jgi:predicted DCC family thiol-disulfide oxidoreductase YuxK